VPAKFWQFVQKQHTAMRKGNFSRTRLAAAANQSRSAGTVVWIAKGPLKDKIALGRRAVNIA
jgi:hypothetical protein